MFYIAEWHKLASVAHEAFADDRVGMTCNRVLQISGCTLRNYSVIVVVACGDAGRGVESSRG